MIDGWVPAVVAVIGVLVYWRSFNAITAAYAKAEEGWAGIEVQLTRRHDLIPSLIHVAKAANQQESQMLAELSRAHIAAVQAVALHDKTAIRSAEDALTASLRAMLDHLGHRSVQSGWAEVLSQVARTEDQIAASRRIYNGNAAKYNAKLLGFPGVILRDLHDFTPLALYQASSEMQDQRHLYKALEARSD